uniref:Uncharacterized protein n=1 Tax=Oncorhynchus tshawytscha TaxID=74940 RepID=A0A8C8G0J1_ONCTS
MKRGWKIYAAHHPIQMPVEMASLKCQPSSINQETIMLRRWGGFYGVYSWTGLGPVFGLLTLSLHGLRPRGN